MTTKNKLTLVPLLIVFVSSIFLLTTSCADDCLNTSGICDPEPEDCPPIMAMCYDWAENQGTWGSFKSCLKIRQECTVMDADLTDTCNDGVRVCRELANDSSSAAACDRIDESCPDLVFRN